ncbi:MAG: PTS sugar transporter subunit IIA [Luteolibacter sp.]|uniref:PTS sugar transporter subunit IIA n=1 Tax=Luteolibacter sp. TaxID=1962973 RepID=UPI0032633EB4
MTLPHLTFAAPPLLDFAAVDENDAVRRTADLLAIGSGITNFGGFVDAVIDRQRINPPLLGNGVAIPHARTVLASEIVCVAARCASPIPFGPEAEPVRLIFLLGIPPHRISEYLELMSVLVKRLRDPEVLNGLLTAETPEEFTRLLA